MHADVKPTASASFLCVFPAFPLFGCNVCERETPTYLPHPGHSYFYADNGGPLVFVTPKTPFTASVCVDFYSCMRHKRKHGCGDIICGGRLHKCWSVPLFVSSHGFFFSPMELLGPGPTLRCYWTTQTQSPAPACVTWPPLISSLLLFFNMPMWGEDIWFSVFSWTVNKQE